MVGLISNEELVFQLERYIPECSELNIISAFVTKPAVCWLEQLTDINGPSICIVGRFSPLDFITGASDINAISLCISKGYNVKALPNLHAKIYQVDSDLIFTGSANLTGKGLSLVEEGNLESCTKVASSESSKSFIVKLISTAIEITPDIFDQMKLFIEQFSSSQCTDIPTVWPEDLMPKINEMFVSDFPFGKPGESNTIYVNNPSLEFSAIELNKGDAKVAGKLFKNSKAYRWLLSQIDGNIGERDLGFGKISSLLHDALSDDPAPYRRDVKDLQANLYEYIKLYACDEVLVYIPGGKSQVLKRLK